MVYYNNMIPCNIILCYSRMLHHRILILYCLKLYFIIIRMDIYLLSQNFLHAPWFYGFVNWLQETTHMRRWWQSRRMDGTTWRSKPIRSQESPSTSPIDVAVDYLPKLFRGGAHQSQIAGWPIFNLIWSMDKRWPNNI